MTAGSPHKAGANDYLDDRTLNFLIGSGAGSGTDRVARLFADHLSRLLPETTVAPVNNSRAGGRVVASQLWDAEPDGLTIGILQSHLYYWTLQNLETPGFELQNYSFLGSMTRSNRVLVASHASGIRSMADIYDAGRPVIVAANTTLSSHYLEALLINTLLGTRLLPVPGFSGGARNMAVITGEADCQIGSLEAVQPIIDAGAGSIVLVVTGDSIPPLTPAPARLEQEAAGAPNEWIVPVINGAAASGRLIAAPPGVEADRLAILRDLFNSVMANPEFVDEAASVGMVVNASSGDQVQRRLASVFNNGADMSANLQRALQCGEHLAETGTAC
ncbi:MAG: tripartite tricarboxylate transporter substrate-binding protein [Pseudomonadota bacterium]